MAQGPSAYVNRQLTEAVANSRWIVAVRLVQRGDCNHQQRYWAIEQIVTQASERFVNDIIDDCTEDQLATLSVHFITRRLWKCVGHVLRRGISPSQHKWLVEESLKYANEWNFTRYILQHCSDEELECVLTGLKSQSLWKHMNDASHKDDDGTQRLMSRLVSQCQWEAMDRLLQTKRISRELHNWSVVQASKRAVDVQFFDFILPHCQSEEVKCVLPHLVSRRLWKSAGKALERGTDPMQHVWVLERASKSASRDSFVDYILPQCSQKDRDHAVIHLLSRGLWLPVGEILGQGISCSLHKWAVEQALNRCREKHFADFILPHCTEVELQHVVTYMATKGLWEPMDCSSSGKQQREVTTTQHVMSQLVLRGLWTAVAKFLQRDTSPSQRGWVLDQACRHADAADWVQNLFPQCSDEEREYVAIHLMACQKWGVLGKMLKQGLNSVLHRQVVVQAAEHASDDDFDQCILRHCNEDDVRAILPVLVANEKWRCVQSVMHDMMVGDALYTWITGGQAERRDSCFWTVIRSCHVDLSLFMQLMKAATQDLTRAYVEQTVLIEDSLTVVDKLHRSSSDLAECTFWQRDLCESLMSSLLHLLCDVICGERQNLLDNSHHTQQQYVQEIYTHIIACIMDNVDCAEGNVLRTFRNKQKWTSLFTKLANTHQTDPLFLLHFLQGLHRYHLHRRERSNDAILLIIFSILPLFPQLQSAALKTMLAQKRWDVISQACLSHVWEHDRRQLFKAAVEQRQWDVVRQWADHTVHDDQRDWAMKEAFREKQWQVYLLLADHGLTMQEHMHANYILAKYGDWNTVLQMVERGGDITEVSNLLENWVTGNLRKKPRGDATVYVERCKKLIRLRLRFIRNSFHSAGKVLERCMWGSVLFNILHDPTEEFFSQVLHKVIEEEEWYILMHLVRLGMTRGERDWLFPQMVQQQQWGVCRKLLEIGVDVCLCLEALPELLEENQWTLVARVMEYSVDDAVRCQVMQCSFQRREGVLFWHCLTTMNHQNQLSKVTQVTLFHQAIGRDVWQAVKPLVEETNTCGIQHRDLAFLEAIEQHLWDVVDHCQILGADINMEDKHGDTPLHREARKRKWKAVEEIVLRDGKPNLLDRKRASVLNQLISYTEWDSVKLVIKYGGDIHLPAWGSAGNVLHQHPFTPLEAMIDARKLDVILFTFKWCPNQRKGVNARGETALHAACDSDQLDAMETLMVRRADPLALTQTGQSALTCAVLNSWCPERMVAECCRLGFSTHQPAMTTLQDSLLDHIISSLLVVWARKCMDTNFLLKYKSWGRFYLNDITSPLVCAILVDSPDVVVMLYESGACSYTELFTLYTQLPKLADVNTEPGRQLQEKVQRQIEDWQFHDRRDKRYNLDYRQETYGDMCDGYYALYSTFIQTVKKYTGYLEQLATVPRTLVSSCRLVISHCIDVRDKKRHELVDCLPVTVRVRNYLNFSDLRNHAENNSISQRTNQQNLVKGPGPSELVV